MKKNKVTLTTGSTEAFFERVISRAAALDRGESVTPSITINFEDPAELLSVLSAERVRLLAQGAPILWADMPTLPLYRQQRTLLMSKKMYAVSRNPTRWGAGWNMDRWALRQE